MDQIAALQWVKDNIGAFNGDNKAVTLMGHSTGAACVNLLMVSPIARGIEGILNNAVYTVYMVVIVYSMPKWHSYNLRVISSCHYNVWFSIIRLGYC